MYPHSCASQDPVSASGLCVVVSTTPHFFGHVCTRRPFTGSLMPVTPPHINGMGTTNSRRWAHALWPPGSRKGTRL